VAVGYFEHCVFSLFLFNQDSLTITPFSSGSGMECHTVKVCCMNRLLKSEREVGLKITALRDLRIKWK